MKNRERIVNAVVGDPVDRMPVTMLWNFNPWAETMQRWLDEGLRDNAEWREAFKYDLKKDGDIDQINRVRVQNKDNNWNKWFGMDPGIRQIFEINLGFSPKFEYKIIKDCGDTILYQDEYGIINENKKTVSALPHGVAFPVTGWKDWEKLKEERLQFNIEDRLPANWDNLADELNQGEQAVEIGMYPYGLFGTLRDLMGVENFLLACYKESDLIMDIMTTLTDLWISIYKKVSEKVKIDSIHMWEDMSGINGPLLAPRFIKKFMVPNYLKIKKFANETGIKIFSLDTDGNVDKLLPILLESGINMIYPFEVPAGSDVIKYGEQYPELCMYGGIDKGKIALGKDEIHKELKRIEPLLDRGRYFPALDHGPHPDISYQTMDYYTKSLRELVYKHSR